MKAIINGITSGPLQLAKGGNESLNVLVFEDNGDAINITGGSIDVVVYDRSDRANAAKATHSGDTLTTPLAGFATVAIDDSELTYGPGEYYAFIRYTSSGANIFFSQPYTLIVR